MTPSARSSGWRGLGNHRRQKQENDSLIGQNCLLVEESASPLVQAGRQGVLPRAGRRGRVAAAAATAADNLQPRCRPLFTYSVSQTGRQDELQPGVERKKERKNRRSRRLNF